MTLDELIDIGDPREIKRATSVKLFLSGLKREQISHILNVGVDFVTKWNRIYRQQGVEGLFLGYQGSDGYLNDDERRAIHYFIKAHNTISIEQLSNHIRNHYGVRYSSVSSYHKLLHEAGMSWKKTEKVNPKRDEDAVLKKREDIKKIEANAAAIKSGELVVLIEDECHLLWGDVCGHVWGKKGEQTPVPVLNQKTRQTYYGVINYFTKEFILKPYNKGNAPNTVDFIKFLRKKFTGSRLLFIWDGASYHNYAETREYLNEINAGIEKEQWPVECLLFASNAPDQNPVEDIWLQTKNHIRKHFMACKTFAKVKRLFENFASNKEFTFPKLSIYGEIV